jgi:hypothetical protein
MKHTLFTFFLVFSFLTSIAQPLPPSCTPNPIYQDSTFGIWPDTLQNLPCAFAGNANGYETVINLKTFTDTVININLAGTNLTLNAVIRAFRIHQLNGMPAGFTWSANEAEWTNTGSAPNLSATQGCVSISAPQSAVQAALTVPGGIDYPLNILVDAKIETLTPSIPFVNANGKWLSELGISALGPIPAPGYRMRVRPGNDGSCENILNVNPTSNNTTFNVLGNFPNPFSKQTEIRLSSPKPAEAKVKVYNMLGKLEISKNYRVEKGENSVMLNAENLSQGIYLYTIEIEGKVITKKLTVSSAY